MNYFRHPARWQLWVRIAFFAVLMNAIAPSVSHLVASARAEGDLFSSSVCVSDPARKPGFVKKIAGSMAFGMEHCGYCLPHGGSDMLVPRMVTGLGLSANHGLRPYLFYRSPKPLLALTAAPPRGPPSLA
ncbi:DUF2946 domain-containing protein [Massilia sp. CF038]|uniref:DUF2946 domain-containing protein n=1 Tax=Massilia sp. CF038 TaxID=1881045 RepID=UPI0027D7E497|nr:DUF2946 domain-containing protein [Massilia sp. CF038]